MTLKQCDFCGKVIRDYARKCYEVHIKDYAFIVPKEERFDVCAECKNKILSMRKVEVTENE